MCSHTPRGRTIDRRHRQGGLLRLRGRARYITFYIKMSRLAATIVAVTRQRRGLDRRDIALEGRDRHHDVDFCSGTVQRTDMLTYLSFTTIQDLLWSQFCLELTILRHFLMTII